MTKTQTVPVLIPQEATARISELRAQQHYEQMVEQVHRLIPGLVEIRVMLAADHEEGGEPAIMLRALVDPRSGGDPTSWRRWREWLTSAFPPDVYRHFTLLTPCVETAHAG